jgi:hypothetical protein
MCAIFSKFLNKLKPKIYNIVKNPATYFEVPIICFMLEGLFAIIWKYSSSKMKSNKRLTLKSSNILSENVLVNHNIYFNCLSLIISWNLQNISRPVQGMLYFCYQ